MQPRKHEDPMTRKTRRTTPQSDREHGASAVSAGRPAVQADAAASRRPPNRSSAPCFANFAPASRSSPALGERRLELCVPGFLSVSVVVCLRDLRGFVVAFPFRYTHRNGWPLVLQLSILTSQRSLAVRPRIVTASDCRRDASRPLAAPASLSISFANASNGSHC